MYKDNALGQIRGQMQEWLTDKTWPKESCIPFHRLSVSAPGTGHSRNTSFSAHPQQYKLRAAFYMYQSHLKIQASATIPASALQLVAMPWCGHQGDRAGGEEAIQV